MSAAAAAATAPQPGDLPVELTPRSFLLSWVRVCAGVFAPACARMCAGMCVHVPRLCGPFGWEVLLCTSCPGMCRGMCAVFWCIHEKHMHAQSDAHARTCLHMRKVFDNRRSVIGTCTHMPVQPLFGRPRGPAHARTCVESRARTCLHMPMHMHAHALSELSGLPRRACNAS